MSARVLITGGAGFIGSHLVDLLLEKGCKPQQLSLLIPRGESLTNLPNLPFSITRGDVRNSAAVSHAAKGIDTVYHLAAKIDFDGKTYNEYQSINVIGTRTLLNACKSKKIKKFVSYSTIGVYGLPAAIGPIEGWDETHPKTYTNFYGRSKWEAELEVVKAHQETGIPYVIIRPASVYGPREKGPTLALYRAIFRKRFLMVGDGMNKMHYVYVKDLVSATYLAAKSGRVSGDYIIAGATPTMFKDVVRHVAASINATVPNIAIPTWLALGLGYGAEAAGGVFGFIPPIFPSRVKTMTTSYYYKIDKAKRELKYNPSISFERGAALTGQWYLENKYL